MTNLKELLALNEQVVGLRRAGSPVSLGLPSNPTALEARLNRLTSELSSHSEEGAAELQQRLLDSDSLPKPYQKTLEVGIREGRLSAAFEGITESAHMSDQLRRDTWVAMAYPILVVFMGFILLGLLAVYSLWQFGVTHDVMHVPRTESTNMAARLSVPGWTWALVPLLLLAAYLVLRWIAARIPSAKSFRSMARWLPGFRRFDRDLRLASFTETLLQLRRNGVTRPDAMSLASVVSGHPISFDRSGHRISPKSVPPLLRWALFEAESVQRGDEDENTNKDAIEFESLEIAADVYRERAAERSHKISRRLPAWTCIAVGICIVLVYALAVWLPFCSMLNELSSASGLDF